MPRRWANQLRQEWFHGGVWLNSGASKRWPGRLTKCSVTVAVTQQSWRCRNHPDGTFDTKRAVPSGRCRSGGPSTAPPSGQSTTGFLPRGNCQTRHGRRARASLKKRATRFARSLQRCARQNIRHPACAKQIASFLCGQHFLRQFLPRDNAATACVADRGSVFHTRGEQHPAHSASHVSDRREK